MDGLAEFEKTIALDKERREAQERREIKHRHHKRRHRHDRRHHHRQHEASPNHGNQDTNQDRHHDTRSGRGEEFRVADETGGDRHRQSICRDDSGRRRKRPRNEGIPSSDDETRIDNTLLKRDSWMTGPTGIDVDYVHRQHKEAQAPLPDGKPRHNISELELNSPALQHINKGKTIDDLRKNVPAATDYTFGDEGSQWRMTKLKGVYTISEKNSRPIEEVAVERFGSLRKFDEAREERIELERRRLHGKSCALKEKPTGDLYRQRNARSGVTIEEPSFASSDSDSDDNDGEPKRGQSMVPIDQTTLNRLRAHLMKAKLRKDPNLSQLEKEYDIAIVAFSSGANNSGMEPAVVLDASHNRMLAGTRGEVKPVETRRGKERGLVEANDDMSIEDMVREERRTRGVAGGEGLRLAERISKDAKFDDDLEYLDENAEKLARHTHKSESTLKNIAVNEFTKMNKVLESCPLCHHEDRNPPQDLPLAPIVSLGTRAFLTLATEPELTGAEGGAVIVPIDHHTNLLECNDDEWEEIRNFMKSLTRLYHDQGRDVIFYENAAAPHRRMHAALIAVPIPYEMGDTVSAFFKEAMLTADEEWSQHKKIIDTGRRAREGMGKSAFRKSIAKEMPYFHVWFTLDGGLGHVIEDANRWPKGDLFAREIIGGMLDADASLVKRQGRWIRNDSRLEDFKKRWRKFDWTRILQGGT